MKLTNQELRTALMGVGGLGNYRLPVKVSHQVSKLKVLLDAAVKPIEETRIKLVKQHQKKETKKGETEETPVVKEDGTPVIADMEAFDAEFKALMEEEAEIAFEDKDKIKLPEKVFSTCDKCHHNMDRPLEIEGNILAALDKFIEV